MDANGTNLTLSPIWRLPLPGKLDANGQRIKRDGAVFNNDLQIAWSILLDNQPTHVEDLDQSRFKAICLSKAEKTCEFERSLPDIVDQLNEPRLKAILSAITKENLNAPNIQRVLSTLDDFMMDTLIPLWWATSLKNIKKSKFTIGKKRTTYKKRNYTYILL